MHIHILGICGTFMGSVAQLAKAKGYRVTGSDKNVYPPMSTQLEKAGIGLVEGFRPEQLSPRPDLVIVGNVISRGNPVMEAVLNLGLPYVSGPQWLAENILRDRWVLAVSGTHGKTTTASMLAWILEYADLSPGYLIGGVPGNFSTSASLGKSDFFVIEADEYDTAFFDKRSKFIHYRPRTLVINNLEFDHADIFENLAAIQKQFHHLIRTVPSQGMIICPAHTPAVDDVLAQGCWSQLQKLGSEDNVAAQKDLPPWRVKILSGGQAFEILFNEKAVGLIRWQLTGIHNVYNALAAVVAARHVGVAPDFACEALEKFAGVKRRMELIGSADNIFIYDDFAHHPTAIKSTLEGLRAKVGNEKIFAVIEPRSNTMKQGVHKEQLLNAIAAADRTLWYQPAGINWNLNNWLEADNSQVLSTIDDIIETISAWTREGGHVVIMSNGGFEGIHNRLLNRLTLGEKTT